MRIVWKTAAILALAVPLQACRVPSTNPGRMLFLDPVIGVNLATSAMAAELGLRGVSAFASTGPAVEWKGETSDGKTSSVMVAVPLPSEASVLQILDSPSERVIVLYERRAPDADAVLRGKLTRRQFSIDNGFAIFRAPFAGTFQAVMLADVVAMGL